MKRESFDIVVLLSSTWTIHPWDIKSLLGLFFQQTHNNSLNKFKHTLKSFTSTFSRHLISLSNHRSSKSYVRFWKDQESEANYWQRRSRVMIATASQLTANEDELKNLDEVVPSRHLNFWRMVCLNPPPPHPHSQNCVQMPFSSAGFDYYCLQQTTTTKPNLTMKKDEPPTSPTNHMIMNSGFSLSWAINVIFPSLLFYKYHIKFMTRTGLGRGWYVACVSV